MSEGEESDQGHKVANRNIISILRRTKALPRLGAGRELKKKPTGLQGRTHSVGSFAGHVHTLVCLALSGENSSPYMKPGEGGFCISL